MRIAALPDANSISLPKSGTGRRAKLFDTSTQPLDRNQAESDSLIMDAHTLRDLEIFEAEGTGTSLYALCKKTRTEGGANILHQRMSKPWSNPTRIRETQEAISFIINNRDPFAKLPAYITQSVENYQRGVLLMVTEVNRIEFSIGAFLLWLNHDRHYRNIVHGVQIACSVIRSLRRFSEQVELDTADGELAPLIEEIRYLLSRPKLLAVPEKEIGGSIYWKVLRLDQIFRFQEKKSVLRLLQLIYEIDALVSLADTTAQNNFVIPEVEEGTIFARAEGLAHPGVENAVSNNVLLDQGQRVLFLTGPNMAGKTTYLRAFATALYLAQLGMGVPAMKFTFSPTERLFSSLSLNDSLHEGVSYFRAEALRVKAVAEAISEGHRVVAIMDEPFKGTNVKDAFDASLSILQRFALKENCLFMFSSHLIELGEKLHKNAQIKKCFFEAQETTGKLKFDYLIRPGISSQRLGIRVLIEEGVFELLGDLE